MAVESTDIIGEWDLERGGENKDIFGSKTLQMKEPWRFPSEMMNNAFLN